VRGQAELIRACAAYHVEYNRDSDGLKRKHIDQEPKRALPRRERELSIADPAEEGVRPVPGELHGHGPEDVDQEQNEEHFPGAPGDGAASLGRQEPRALAFNSVPQPEGRDAHDTNHAQPEERRDQVLHRIRHVGTVGKMKWVGPVPFRGSPYPSGRCGGRIGSAVSSVLV